MTGNELLQNLLDYQEKYPEVMHNEIEVYDDLGRSCALVEVTGDGMIQLLLGQDEDGEMVEFWNPDIHNEPEEPSKN